MRAHERQGLKADPRYLTNWLGVRIDPKFFPEILTNRAGELEPIPLPANWHADIAEWAAALRAVDLAPKDSFTMIELGCGWGCWMNNAGAAARHSGRRVHVIGVEGDEGHVQFASESLSTNGFPPEAVTLHRGIASARRGVALFPKQAVSGVAWGLEPVFDATDAQVAEAEAAGTHDRLPMISMEELVRGHARIDLLHLDIQGGEADFVETCLPVIDQHVAYMVIGTHSKMIEGRLHEMLMAAGWRLEMERPAIFDVSTGRPIVSVDGVQGWRNPKRT